jgi:thioredoxin
MLEITNIAEFERLVDGGGRILVDFWAPWCGPCRMLALSLDELERGVQDLVIVKVNVDDSPEISAAYGVQSVPTVILFSGGAEVKSRTGFASAAALLSWMGE